MDSVSGFTSSFTIFVRGRRFVDNINDEACGIILAIARCSSLTHSIMICCAGSEWVVSATSSVVQYDKRCSTSVLFLSALGR